MRQQAIRASIWAITGMVGAQGIRLASNLVLTRLLFPEAFGLMAIVNVFVQGLQMMSDVGIGVSIIQSRRGDEPAFLNTVWTIQIMRGAAVWLCACIFAWPLAKFYGSDEILALIPAVGVASLVSGFNSSNLSRLNRHLALARLVLLEMGSQLFGVAVMILVAWRWPTVWSLVIGAIAGSFAKMLLSHLAIPGPRSRLHWDREAATELIRFGKWILLSSTTSFVAAQGDRLLLGRLLSLDALGVYAIAFFLADSPGRLVSTLQHRVLFPVLSKIGREERSRLSEIYYRARLRIEWLVLPMAMLLIAAGHDLVELLYDDRYIEAGWMLRILAIRILIGVLAGPGTLCLMALGRSQYAFLAALFQAIWLFVLVPVAMQVSGPEAVIWVIALHGVLSLFIVLYGLRENGVLSMAHELRSALLMGVATVAGIFAWDAVREPLLALIR